MKTRPLEEALGYRFKDPKLLIEALSHKSHASEARTGIDNERLEFLGDSILGAVVAHQLFVRYPQQTEGGLSKRKSVLVSRANLARSAAVLNLGPYLYLGVGEEASGGRERQSLLGNVLEAIIGAIYLDGGYQAASRFIRTFCMSDESPAEVDWKSRLQEVVMKTHRVTPAYNLADTAGPPHDMTFHIVIHLGRKVLGKGSGKSKKEAEQAAAADAFEKMGNQED